MTRPGEAPSPRIADPRRTVGDSPPKTSLSIVIPFFNEEDGIPQLHAQLSPVVKDLSGRYDVELVFVNDGSSDNSVELIRRSWPLATIVSHVRNQGLGAGLRTGAQNAQGELVLFIDSDCTYPPHEIRGLLACLGSDIDIVTASPYHPRGGVKGVPKYRRVLSQGLSILYRLATGSSVWTYTSMFRVYRRGALSGIERWSDGYVALAETLVLPILAGRTVHEFPTILYTRRYSVSKMRIASSIGDHLRLLLDVAAIRLGRPLPRRRTHGVGEVAKGVGGDPS